MVLGLVGRQQNVGLGRTGGGFSCCQIVPPNKRTTSTNFFLRRENKDLRTYLRSLQVLYAESRKIVFSLHKSPLQHFPGSKGLLLAHVVPPHCNRA